jgi:hypothetical protein
MRGPMGTEHAEDQVARTARERVHMIDQRPPVVVGHERAVVAHDVQGVARAGEGNVEPPAVRQKTQALHHYCMNPNVQRACVRDSGGTAHICVCG